MIEMQPAGLEIETERLRLRTFKPKDLEPLYRIWNDAEVMKFVRPGWQPSRQDVATYIERIKLRWAKQGFGHFAIALKDDDQPIGYCGFQYLEESPEIELLYGLAKSFWGHGYVSEAAIACLSFAYTNTNLDRIVALAYPENKGSLRVMEKVGMKYEKMAREKGDDLVLYVITRRMFEVGHLSPRAL